MTYLIVILALLVGALMPFQAAINGQLTTYLKHPLQGAFVSFLVGAITLGIINLFLPLPELKKLATIPPHYFIGGILGVIFVTASIVFIPKIGATAMIASFVTGQLLMSLVIDHYGLLVTSAHPTSPLRFTGVLLLLSGLFLILRF